MTGFGRAYDEYDGMSYEIVIKGVNSRFVEFNFKLPPALSGMEQDLRALLQHEIRRGKVTVIVNGHFDFLTETRLVCDRRAVRSYLDICRSMSLPTTGQAGAQARWEALRIPGVLKVCGAESLTPKGRALLFGLVRDGLSAFVKSKQIEGRKMRRVLKSYTRRLRILSKYISARSGVLKKQGEERVHELARRFCEDAGALRDRIGFEIAATLDKLDVSEECSRLAFHLKELESVLDASAPSSGRKLDFLLQELNREVNTIGAKGRDSQMSRWVVSSKDYLERMREQVQNIE